MASDLRRRHWDGVYASKAETEMSWFEASPRLSFELVQRACAGKTSPIVDVGGGLSRLADELVRDGYGDVTVLDVSKEAIAKVMERSGGAGRMRGIVADVTGWRPDRRYAVWHDRAVLHFLTNETDRVRYRETLLAALAPDGQAVIATFAPSGPDRCSGLPVRRYGPKDIESFFEGSLRLVEAFEFDHATPGGGVQRFHVGRLRRFER